MASAQKFLYHLDPSVPTSDEYSLKRTALQHEILDLLKDICSDINFTESQLKILFMMAGSCVVGQQNYMLFYTLFVYTAFRTMTSLRITSLKLPDGSAMIQSTVLS